MSLKNENVVHTPKRIALVIANPTISTTTGWTVGFWWSELTHTWYEFTQKGYAVTIFSPDGGACVPDQISDPDDASGYSASDLISRGFIHSPTLKALINDTATVSSMAISDFDALVVAGGQSPMFTFEKATTLHDKFLEFYQAGKIACALCHGVSILRYVKTRDGQYLVNGKTITGFSNAEEDFADNAAWDYNMLTRGVPIMPWRIEDELKKLGANYIQAGLWKGFAIRDGNLITGQQNFSGSETARLVIQALGE